MTSTALFFQSSHRRHQMIHVSVWSFNIFLSSEFQTPSSMVSDGDGLYGTMYINQHLIQTSLTVCLHFICGLFVHFSHLIWVWIWVQNGLGLDYKLNKLHYICGLQVPSTFLYKVHHNVSEGRRCFQWRLHCPMNPWGKLDNFMELRI